MMKGTRKGGRQCRLKKAEAQAASDARLKAYDHEYRVLADHADNAIKAFAERFNRP